MTLPLRKKRQTTARKLHQAIRPDLRELSGKFVFSLGGTFLLLLFATAAVGQEPNPGNLQFAFAVNGMPGSPPWRQPDLNRNPADTPGLGENRYAGGFRAPQIPSSPNGVNPAGTTNWERPVMPTSPANPNPGSQSRYSRAYFTPPVHLQPANRAPERLVTYPGLTGAAPIRAGKPNQPVSARLSDLPEPSEVAATQHLPLDARQGRINNDVSARWNPTNNPGTPPQVAAIPGLDSSRTQPAVGKSSGRPFFASSVTSREAEGWSQDARPADRSHTRQRATGLQDRIAKFLSLPIYKPRRPGNPGKEASSQSQPARQVAAVPPARDTHGNWRNELANRSFQADPIPTSDSPVGTGVMQTAIQEPVLDPFGDNTDLPQNHEIPDQRDDVANLQPPVSILNRLPNGKKNPASWQQGLARQRPASADATGDPDWPVEEGQAAADDSIFDLEQNISGQPEPGIRPLANRQPQDEVLPPGRTANGLRNPGQMESNRDCDEYRELLLGNPITAISLDMSPLRSSQKMESRMNNRDWYNRKGELVATGRMIDMRRGYVILETEAGEQQISYARLSDSDLAAVASAWRIPVECTISFDEYVERAFAPQTVTWKPSGLCHKPLYFEDIQLERYGHSHGPFLQPAASTAHFFVCLAMLPYHTAIHPPTECEYALGFYRPGNCAPWLKDPFPISLSGASREALFITGLAFLP